MKILAFADIHTSATAIKNIKDKAIAHDVDYIVCVGDFTIFGSGLLGMLKKFNEFEKLCLIVHGNHEEERKLRTACSQFRNLRYIHATTYRDGNCVFIGWGGGGFSFFDKAFEAHSTHLVRQVKPGDTVVFVTHQPPYNTKVDQIMGQPVGNKSFRKFIDKEKPALVLCGHLHENFNKEDMVGPTRIINPGKTGTLIDL
ncbi:metallophosphoesterase family protein [Candidatus Woesearchaeota archaeon]|nr:metallophosphoesterase family protein [Candidatus Woesearchaeota archaeon]